MTEVFALPESSASCPLSGWVTEKWPSKTRVPVDTNEAMGSSSQTRTYDVVVIGSGPAGEVLAGRMAVKGHDVPLARRPTLCWNE